MKKFLRILKWVGLVVALLVIGLVVAVYSLKDRTFEAPLPAIKASTDTAVIARGKYLVNGPAHCAHCHVPNDKMGLVDEGQMVPMSGGRLFELPIGNIYTPNITSDKETGIGGKNDGEIARVLRYGVKTDGHALFPFMPFYDIAESDLLAIVSYLRTLEPVKNEVPKNTYNFMGNVVRAFIMKPEGMKTENRPKILTTVNPDSSTQYGEYLARYVANCVGCHTDRDLKTGEFIGPEFAGGFKLPGEGNMELTLVSPNITPDPETGIIYNWNEEMFIKRFRSGRTIKESPMPWGPFSRMSDLELKALYRFLKTVKPVKQDNGPTVVKTADLK
jgi:mono/diheme cytochrome c family protein